MGINLIIILMVSECYIRKLAIEKINDETHLIDIAKNDSDDNVRLESIKKINDESFLIDMAKNDSNSNEKKYSKPKKNFLV